MKILSIKDIELNFVVKELKKGKIFIMPTDTSYGIVGKISFKIISNIYKIKKRPKEKLLPIFVDKNVLEKLAVVDERAKILVTKFWPGSLTLILKAKPQHAGFLKPVLGSKNTIAVREPNYKLILKILKTYKLPITATSANISCNPPAYKPSDVLNYFSKNKPAPDYFVNAGALLKNPVSTIIDISADDLKILRQGPVKEKDITPHLTD